MNPLHYIKGTGINEYFNNWILPWVMPYIKATMYDETEIEKRIKHMRGTPEDKKGDQS